MSCPTPISAAILADYWLAALTEAEEQATEEHLFACDECGARLREIIALAEEVRRVARAGSLRMVVNDSILQRAANEGRHVREYAPPPGGAVQCTVTAEDDFLIARLAANLSGAKRVDLSLCNEDGVEHLRLPDIPFHAAAPAIVYQESIPWAKAMPSNHLLVRMIAFDATDREHLLGEYHFHHTRSLPGPGSPP